MHCKFLDKINIGLFYPTKSMQQSPSQGADRASNSERNPCISRNRKVHYWIHNIPPLVPFPVNLVHPLLPAPSRHILVLSPTNTQVYQEVSFLHISSKSSTHFSIRKYCYMFHTLQTLWYDHARNIRWPGD
jgi:hypothetical protein